MKKMKITKKQPKKKISTTYTRSVTFAALQSKHKKKVKELEERIGRLRQFSQAAFEALALSKKGIILDVNDQFTKLFGYDHEDLIGKKAVHLVAPESRKLVLHNIMTGYQIPYEHLALKKDGTIFPVEAHEKNLRYKGRPLRVTAIRDITQRKKAERDLLLIRQAIDNAGEGIYWVDKDARIVNANVAGCRQLGYSKKKLLSMSVYDVDPYFPKEQWQSNWEELKQKGFLAFEARHRHKSGTIFPVEVRLTYIQFDDTEYSFSFVRDITERKKAQKELENIFNLSPDILCVCTPEGKFVKINHSAERILGYTLDEILALGWAKLVHPDDVQSTNDQVKKQLKGNPTVNFINRFRCKDGNYKTLEWQASPSIGGIVYAIARDITARKKAEEVLRENEAKSRSILNTSNELISIVDKNAQTLWANDAWQQMFGRPREILDPFANVHPEDLASVKENWKGIVEDNENIENAEYRFKNKNGIYLIFATSVRRVGDFFYVFSHDITERTKHLHELEVFYKASIGREEQILTLKKKVKLLEEQVKKRK